MTTLAHPDIPPAERSLMIGLVELGSPWTSAPPIERVLAAIEQLGLPLALATADLRQTWFRYDRASAAAAVWPGGARTEVMLASDDRAILASVARLGQQPGQFRNVVTVRLSPREVATRGVTGVEAMIAQLVAALPAFTFASASAANQVRFPSLIDLWPLPFPLHRTAWLHVLAPSIVRKLGGAERLLAAPTRVEQRADRTIWMHGYPDPMAYDTEAAVAAMGVLAPHHFGEHAYDVEEAPRAEVADAGADEPSSNGHESDELLCLSVVFPGHIAASVLAPALDALVANPWAPLTEQCADTREEWVWRPCDRDDAHAILDRDRRSLLLREREGAGAVEGQAWNARIDTVAILYVPAARTAPDDPRLRAYLTQMLAALPPGAHASIFSTAAHEQLRTEVPRPLHRAVWLVALPVASYERRFARTASIAREVLLAAPGAVVDEDADGTIWLQLPGTPYVPEPGALDALQTYLAERALR